MAITKSAKKSIRQNLRRKKHNLLYRNKMKAIIKEIRALISDKKTEEAGKILPKAYEILDKSAKVGIIKKNAASRIKSRLAKAIKS